MKAIVRYGKEFGGYTMRDVPKPVCGPEDIILKIEAAAICGADMKHWRVNNGSDEFNSIRGQGLYPITAPMFAVYALPVSKGISSAANIK